MTYEITVNGRRREVDVEAGTPLLLVLRNDLGLVAAKYGCGVGLCGACMVWLDGHPTPSCDVPIEYVEQRAVRTLEDLGTAEQPHAVQAAFLERQAGQCGYCLAGILVTAAAHLRDHPDTGRDAVVEVLDRHLCRCGTQQRIVDAVLDAAASPGPSEVRSSEVRS